MGVGYAPSVLTALLLVASLVGLVFLVRRVITSYPPAPAGLAVLHRGEAAFVDAVAEVLFPTTAGLGHSGPEVQLPHYIDRHLAALPSAQRWQIRALFAAIEHGTLLLPGDEPGGRARFSSLGAASRVAILERLAHHERSGLRLAFTALRSVFVLGYLGHPANLQALGLAPFEIEPAVSDAELLFPRIGALPSSIRFDEADRTDPTRLGPLDPNGPRHRAYARGAASPGGTGSPGRAGPPAAQSPSPGSRND